VGTTFTLDLHPEAARSFDEKAERLLSLVSEVPVSGQRQGSFRPAIHPRACFTEKEIVGEIEVGFVDYRGREFGKTFCHEGKTFGLMGDGYKSLEDLAAQVQQTKGIRPYISARCLAKTTFQWVRKRCCGETKEAFTGFVVRECGAQVKDSEVWLPLYHVYIQSDFSVGKIRFRTLRPEMLNVYLDQGLEHVSPADHDKFRVEFERTRSRFQGCAAATIALTGEPLRVEEIATEQAECSISVLRFFHAANQTPYVRSYCTFNGMENLSVVSALVVKNGTIERWDQSLRSSAGSTWVLSDRDVQDLQSAGLEALGSLLLKTDMSPLESELLDAVLLYSRNSLFDDPANRLVSILAALESILIRDSSEPVGKNAAERLAFVVGRTTEERIAIRDNVAKVYNLRSRFLHHGREPQDMDCLELFMRYVWTGLVALIHGMDKFRTKQDLIAALERRKME